MVSPFRPNPIALVAVAVVLPLLATSPAGAQERADSVRAELERLRARIDSLEIVIRRLQEEGAGPGAQAEPQDELARLREAAAAAAAQGEVPGDTTSAQPEAVGRQRSLQALNPEISVNADVFGHVNIDDAGEQNFVPREFEMSLQSALDPFSRAKIFMGIHGSGPELLPFGEGHGHEEGAEGDEEGHGEGGELAVEEGYVEWVGLPGGVNVKLGRFYQQLGALNRWHSHALPFQSRSLPHLAFVGEEPLGQTGVSAAWLVPFAGAGTYQATLEVTRSSNESLFGESSGPGVLANLNGFWELGEASDLDLHLSWVNGSWESETALFDRNLYAVEAAYTWSPPARSKYRGLVVRGGVMLLDGLAPHDEDPGAEPGHEPGEGDATGVWSLAEVRLDRQWLAGARFDWTEDPTDPDRTAWLVSPTVTWWQSEYVRLRLEYDLLGRSFLDDNEGRLWLQVTFAMGPHKHETY